MNTPVFNAQVKTFKIAMELAGMAGNMAGLEYSFKPPYCLRIVKTNRTASVQQFRNKVARVARKQRAMEMKRLDAIDQLFITNALKERELRKCPEVGDFVIMEDGSYERFSHDWGDDIQTTDGKFGSSFHLTKNGYGGFSGGLNAAIMKNRLILTSEIKEGSFWIFHHNHATAHNGVYFNAPVRVYQYLGA